MCINIVEIWFGIANEQYLSIFLLLPTRTHSYFSFQDINKSQRISNKHDICIDNVEIWFGIANGRISSFFDRVICPEYDDGGVLSFHVLYDI